MANRLKELTAVRAADVAGDDAVPRSSSPTAGAEKVAMARRARDAAATDVQDDAHAPASTRSRSTTDPSPR